jgi:hypothetical protein
MSTPTKEVPLQYQGHRMNGKKLMIFDQHVEMELADGMSKAITLSDFHSVLAGALKVQEEAKGYLMPTNCYYFAIGINEMQLCCYYPGKIREIIHMSRDESKTNKYKIPFPNIVVSHKLRRTGDKIEWIDAKYLATSKTIGQVPQSFLWDANPSDQVWPLPFSNVYDTGKLCYGGNSKPQTFGNNLRGLDWHFAILYTSPFNDDLGIRGTVDSHRPGAWYKILAKHTVFPYELLRHGIKPIESNSLAGNMMVPDVTINQEEAA